MAAQIVLGRKRCARLASGAPLTGPREPIRLVRGAGSWGAVEAPGINPSAVP
jgi:hypothetical protein